MQQLFQIPGLDGFFFDCISSWGVSEKKKEIQFHFPPSRRLMVETVTILPTIRLCSVLWLLC